MKAYSNKIPMYEFRTQRVEASPKDLAKAHKIQGITSSFFGFDVTDIMKRNRKALVKDTRHVIGYMIRKHTKLPLSYIAPYQGLTNHSSVIHSFRVVHDLITVDDEFAARVSELESYILSIVKD